MNDEDISYFLPESMNFQDDFIHKSGYFSSIETWYYDALLNNGFSIVSLVNVIRIGKVGRVLSGIFIYKNGKILKSIREKYSIQKLYAASNSLHFSLNDRDLLKGEEKTESNWSYIIHRGDQMNGFDLRFIRTLKPFKGKTFLGSWFVIPGFSVYGELYIDGAKTEVSGIGYHDHNIYSLTAPFFVKGYFFGKIHLDNNEVIWAQIDKKKRSKELLVMLCDQDSFYSIHPDYIQFSIEDFKKVNGKEIPISCRLTIDDPKLGLDVNFFSDSPHFLGMKGVTYWRYHFTTQGSARLHDENITIKRIGIGELLKFF